MSLQAAHGESDGWIGLSSGEGAFQTRALPRIANRLVVSGDSYEQSVHQQFPRSAAERAAVLGAIERRRLPRGDYGAGFTMVLESNVTAAIRARTLPFSVAPVLMVMA